MGRTIIKSLGIVLSVTVLLAMLGLVAGCGEEKQEGTTEIRIAILTDFTGPAAYAAQQHTNGFMDYFSMLEEKDPIPGAKIKVLTYDQRSDFARVIPGYLWLKGQGAVLVHPVSGDDFVMLESRFEQDHIPGINAYLQESSPNFPWTFAQGVSSPMETEVALQWIMDTWDYDGKGRPPKIGHQGWARESSVKYQAGIDRMLEWYPDKFEFVSFQSSPVGNTSWAVEVGKLQDCDYIYLSMVGAMLGSFTKEARARGLQCSFLSASISYTGFWPVVRSSVPADELYGCYFFHFVPWWTQDILYVNSLREAILKYHPDEAEDYMAATGPVAGWGIGMFVAQAIRDAVERVGAENVDGTALRDALAELDMTVEGWDYPWRFSEDHHLLLRDMKAYQWSVAENVWECVSGSYIPHSLAG